MPVLAPGYRIGNLVDTLSRIVVHDHLCLIYETKEEQFAAVVPYIRLGLERGERCLYIADENTAQAVLEALKAGGIQTDDALRSGQLVLASKRDAYLKQGYFDPDWMIRFLAQSIEAAKAAGHSALRVTGEMTWQLGGDRSTASGQVPGVERLIEYEAKLNHFFPQYDALAICQYNRTRFSPEIICDVIRTHPLVIYSGLVCQNFYYVPPDEFLKPNQPSLEAERLLSHILERERVEQALKEAEHKYRAIFENAVLGIAQTTFDGRFIAANPALATMLGFESPAELVASVTDIAGQMYADPAERAKLIALLQQTGAVSGYEMQARRKDGSLIWIALNARIVGGDSLYIEVVVADITGRKRAEESLRTQAKQQAAVAELGQRALAATDLSALMDEATALVAQTLAVDFCKVLELLPDGQSLLLRAGVGWQEGRVGRATVSAGKGSQAGYTLLSDAPVVVTDLRAETRFAAPPLLREHGVVSGMSTVIRGRRRPFGVLGAHATRLRTFSEDDIHFLQAVADILGQAIEEQRAAARLRLLGTALEAAANGIVIADRDGVIQWVNPAFTQLTGYSAEEAIGRNLRVLKSGEQDRAFYTNLWETILSGQVWRGEIVNRRKDGSLYTEDMTITPVREAGGAITHFIAIKQDITERKQRQRELEVIAAVSGALRQAQTRAEMAPVVLEQILILLNTDSAALIMRDPVTEETVVEEACGVWAGTVGQRLPAGAGLSGDVIRTGQPFLTNDLQGEPHVARLARVGNLRAGAAVPLIAHGEIMGVLAVGSQAAIADGQLRLLSAVADITANAIHRASLHEQAERRVRQLAALHTIDTAISASLDLRVTLNILLDNVIGQQGVDAADVLLLSPYSQTLEYAAGRGFRTRSIESSRLRVGEGQAGSAVLERRRLSFPDLAKADPASVRASAIADEAFISHHVVPLVAKGQAKGVLEVFHRSRLDPEPEWLEFFETLAIQAAIAIENAGLFEGLQHTNTELIVAYDATIEGWSRALELRDRETEGHTLRVTEMTLRLARAMGIGEDQWVHIRRGALLHDIGKMGVPDSILLKPGKLADEEWEIMRRHPQYAYDMLSPIAYLRPALDIPLCHHERWDGSGYPRGLKGEEIPLVARVFAVVDVWDALCSDRPYRAAWPEQAVREHIRSLAGAHFDPKAVEKFLAMA